MALILVRGRRPTGKLLAEREDLLMQLYFDGEDERAEGNFVRFDLDGEPIFSCRPHRLDDIIKMFQEAKQKLGG